MTFLKSRRGSITIFQLIIFSALLLFTGVLVDAVRIMTAERTVQSALNTAVRSTLAEYDKQLVGDYGIFAIDASTQDGELREHFMKYLNYNISDNNESFRFIDYEVDPAQTRITAQRNLLDDDDNAFKEQIVEYMKYKAPIILTKNVVDKVLSSGIFKKKEFSEKEKDTRLSSNEVKTIAGKAGSKMSELNKEKKAIESYTIDEANGNEFVARLKRIKVGYEDLGGVLDTLRTSLADYSQKAQISKEFGEEANKDENLQGDAAIHINGTEFENAQESVQETEDVIKSSSQSLEALLSDIEPLQKKVEEWNNRIQSLKNSNEKLRKSIKSLQAAEDGEDNTGEIEDLRNDIQDNEDEIFDYKEKIDNNVAEINDLKNKFKLGDLSELKMNPAEDSKDKYSSEAPDKSADNSQLESLKSELEKYIAGKVIQEGWLISSQDFSEAKAENEKLIMKMQNKKVNEDEEMAEADNEELFKLLDQLEGALNSGMENMVVVEYILDRFTYHTSLTERGHYFEKGEVEYILWGSKQQNLNIAAAVSSIGFLRFAINSIDYFAASQIPHPVLRLVYSVGRGLAQAFKDSLDLYQGKQIPISPSLNKANTAFKLNYADHLRLFLLMQSIADPRMQLNNTRQLIQVNLKNPDENDSLQNPDFQLGKYNTLLNGKVETKINLWFLPMFHLDKLNPASFDGRRYRITKEINIGY